MAIDINEIYKSIQNEGEVIVAYKGSISGNVISQTLQDVEYVFEKKINEKPKLAKKTYNVLVEVLQNLYHHIEMPPKFIDNSENVNKFAIFVFIKLNDFAYKLTTGNFIRNERKQFLKDRIDQINFLTADELKDLYKKVLNNDEFSSKGGGGLGMIDIAKKTGNKLGYRFEEYDKDFQFFILEIVLT